MACIITWKATGMITSMEGYIRRDCFVYQWFLWLLSTMCVLLSGCISNSPLTSFADCEKSIFWLLRLWDVILDCSFDTSRLIPRSWYPRLIPREGVIIDPEWTLLILIQKLSNVWMLSLLSNLLMTFCHRHLHFFIIFHYFPSFFHYLYPWKGHDQTWAIFFGKIMKNDSFYDSKR